MMTFKGWTQLSLLSERTNIAACVFWRLEILFQILARVVCKYCRTQAPLYSYTLRLYFFNKINGFINKIWSLSELNYRKNYIFYS